MKIHTIRMNGTHICAARGGVDFNKSHKNSKPLVRNQVQTWTKPQLVRQNLDRTETVLNPY